jgi:hypothetical protein
MLLNYQGLVNKMNSGPHFIYLAMNGQIRGVKK